jgi:mannose-1-phosphate guanylyltransferase
MTSDMICKGIILVGGPTRGTRFRPLSLNVPKPLFPIAGFPSIYHHISALANIEGMKEIIIIGFFEATLFQPFINEAASTFPSIPVRYLREYQSLGTAGGLYMFREQILKGDPQIIFLMHGDVCSPFPLNEMLNFHLSHKGTCTILGTKVPKEVANKYGCIVSGNGGAVTHYVEKPETFVSDLISCGVFVFSNQMISYIGNVRQNNHSRNPSFTGSLSALQMDENENNKDYIGLEKDVFRSMINSNELFVFESKDFWCQIKSAGSALQANSLYLQNYRKVKPELLKPISPKEDENNADRPTTFITGNVYIHPSASVHPTAKLGPNVSIGPRVVIKEGVRVKDSIILDNTVIENFSCVTHSIIGWEGHIGSWVFIQGTPGYAEMSNYSPASNLSNLGGVNYLGPTTDLMLPNGTKNGSACVFGADVKVKNETIIRNCIVLPHKELKNARYQNEILM